MEPRIIVLSKDIFVRIYKKEKIENVLVLIMQINYNDQHN